MKKQFATYEISKALKELGFDENCFGYYENQDKHLVIYYSNLNLTDKQNKRPSLYKSDNKNYSLPQWATSAPTWQQVIDWFREKHHIHIEPALVVHTLNYIGFIRRVGKKKNVFELMKRNNRGGYDKSNFADTYEECRERSILKAIEIIKNQK